MPFPTIIGIEAATKGQKDYLTLIEQDQKALRRLTDLHDEAQHIPNPEVEAAINHSFETIVKTTPTLMEGYSLESHSDKTVLERIVAGFKMLIEALIRNAKRLYAWIESVILRSKVRRVALTQKFKDLNKELSQASGNITYSPVQVTPKQVNLVIEDNRVPVYMDKALGRLVDVYVQYRTGSSHRLLVELAKYLNSTNIKELDLNPITNRIVKLLTLRDIKTNDAAKKKKSTPEREAVATLLGNATVWLNKPVKDVSDKYGYEVIADTYVAPSQNVTVDLTDPAAIKDCVALNLNLIDELDKLSDQISGSRVHLKRAMKFLEGIQDSIEKDTDSDRTKQLRKACQYSDHIIRTMSLFPSQLYMHGMKVTSAQAMLLKAIVKTGN